MPGAGAHEATIPEEISVPEHQGARQARYLPLLSKYSSPFCLVKGLVLGVGRVRRGLPEPFTGVPIIYTLTSSPNLRHLSKLQRWRQSDRLKTQGSEGKR